MLLLNYSRLLMSIAAMRPVRSFMWDFEVCSVAVGGDAFPRGGPSQRVPVSFLSLTPQAQQVPRFDVLVIMRGAKPLFLAEHDYEILSTPSATGISLKSRNGFSTRATCFTTIFCHVWSTLVSADSGFTTSGTPLAVY